MDDRASVAAMLIAAEELGRMKVKMQAYFSYRRHRKSSALTAHGRRATASIPIGRLRLNVTHGEGPGAGAFEAFEMDKSHVRARTGPFIARSAKRWKKLLEKCHVPYNISVSAGKTWTEKRRTALCTRAEASRRRSFRFRCGICIPPLKRWIPELFGIRGRLMAMMIAVYGGRLGGIRMVLKELCALRGVSGDEKRVRDYILERSKTLCDGNENRSRGQSDRLPARNRRKSQARRAGCTYGRSRHDRARRDGQRADSL